MAGPKKKSKKPSENVSDESISEGSESGSYHGQQVEYLKLVFFLKIIARIFLGNSSYI